MTSFLKWGFRFGGEVAGLIRLKVHPLAFRSWEACSKGGLQRPFARILVVPSIQTIAPFVIALV